MNLQEGAELMNLGARGSDGRMRIGENKLDSDYYTTAKFT